MTTTPQQRLYAIIGAGIVWFALVLQFALIPENPEIPAATAIVNYFSYFTILSNILVALCLTASALGRRGFFLKPGTQTAIVIYIVIVGLVYNAVLRFQWAPKGMARLADELLHSVAPLLFLVYWLLFTSKEQLQWKHIPAWLLFPLIYLGYTLVRGSLMHFYPYPFLDIDKLGYASAVLNCLWVTIAFILCSLLFVALAKAWKKKPLT
ncbi:Pr6Pr family membrane protein [Taibaiella koreensis]|uniref:Pr6Pr family membrane protein n=1 Tax=Taibaiella koreensis TaxID=1268548 RepID=UPI000E59F9DD|nr:Pr6Pr family membrane protein [Taibaiella koreensis]